MTGGASKEDNREEIENIIRYFDGLSEWLFGDFEFLDYFEGYNDLNGDNEYQNKINRIKSKLSNE